MHGSGDKQHFISEKFKCFNYFWSSMISFKEAKIDENSSEGNRLD